MMKKLNRKENSERGVKTMENEVVVNIKREDKKASGKFWFMMFCGLIGGGILGAGGAFILDNLNFSNSSFLEEYSKLQRNIGFGSRYVLIVIVVIFSIIGFLNLKKNKEKFEKWDGKDDRYIEKVEQSMNFGITVTSLMSIFSMVLFGMSTYILADSIKKDGIIFFISFVAYIASIIVTISLQRSFVNLTKQINPEKRGSVLDRKFREKWIDSCDEVEQLITFKATYKSYIVTSLTCSYLIVVLILCGMFFEIGLLPIILVGVIWLVLNLTYIREASKLEKGHNK